MAVTDDELRAFAKAISRVLGWAYFLCWSASFYPQPISNYLRKSTLGLAIDFPTLNVLGFSCYAISSASFLYSPTIRSQYAYRHPEAPETLVRFNDFLFAAHGAIMCVIVYSQFFPRVWGFTVGKAQRASAPVLAIFWGLITSIFIVALLVRCSKDGGYDASGWAWIDVINALGYVKLTTVFLKYIPQAWVNYKRKSTVGWSIYTILLDFSGGWLSLAQLVIDSTLQNDWTGITDNPVKFGLGNITLFFDLLFFLQHYVLYRNPQKQFDEDEVGTVGGWTAERERLVSDEPDHVPVRQ